MDNAALIKVIEIVGSQAELARRVSTITGKPIKQAHVWNWLNRDGEVPADCVLAVSESSEWRVPPHEVRRDLYPNPDDALPACIRAARNDYASVKQA